MATALRKNNDDRGVMMINKVSNVWDGYEYKGVKVDGYEPLMTTYILNGEKARGLVVILPGGGYGMTSPREAEPIALKFNSAGYHSIVVDYSVAPNVYPQSLLDISRVLTIIKEASKEWFIDLDKLYVCGFSAGGHLAASVVNEYSEAWLNDYDGVDLEGLIIKGSILSYPVLSGGEFRHAGSFSNLLGDQENESLREEHSMELLVSKQTPETFIWHTVQDKAVPVENTLLYINALQKAGVTFECHIYPKGPHGISLASEETANHPSQINNHVASWIGLCVEWMDSHK